MHCGKKKNCINYFCLSQIKSFLRLSKSPKVGIEYMTAELDVEGCKRTFSTNLAVIQRQFSELFSYFDLRAMGKS